MKRKIFITGATGYMGSRLVPLLTKRGHEVTALVRAGSEKKLPTGTKSVVGNALKNDSYAHHVNGFDTFIHLIGVPHPSPAKAAQFRSIDLVSAQAAVQSARAAGVTHFIYLSVAQPAPMMEAYIAVRSECEAMITTSGLRASFVRPWYVLGPGHRWPCVLLPFYWICERLPATREGAKRLGLVSLEQMLNALVWSVENPPEQAQIIDVPRIKSLNILDSF